MGEPSAKQYAYTLHANCDLHPNVHAYSDAHAASTYAYHPTQGNDRSRPA